MGSELTGSVKRKSTRLLEPEQSLHSAAALVHFSWPHHSGMTRIWTASCSACLAKSSKRKSWSVKTSASLYSALTSIHPSSPPPFLSFSPMPHMTGPCRHSNYSTSVLPDFFEDRGNYFAAALRKHKKHWAWPGEAWPLPPLLSSLMGGMLEMWCHDIWRDNIVWCSFITFFNNLCSHPSFF